jgi:hypothetical protein
MFDIEEMHRTNRANAEVALATELCLKQFTAEQISAFKAEAKEIVDQHSDKVLGRALALIIDSMTAAPRYELHGVCDALDLASKMTQAERLGSSLSNKKKLSRADMTRFNALYDQIQERDNMLKKLRKQK